MATVITSITGLQNLTNLENFNADYNSLTTVNLSGLTNLLFVDISDNEKLDFSENSLTSVNLSGCTSLQTLRLDDSNFAAGIPNLSGLTDLSYIDMDQCSITGNVDLSMLPALEEFDLGGNAGLTSVTISDQQPLRYVNLYDTALTEASVNDILETLDNNGIEGGSVNLQSGTSAAPTGAGATAATNLEAKGWSVTVNVPPTTTTTTTVEPTTTTSTTTVAPTTTTTTTTITPRAFTGRVEDTEEQACAGGSTQACYSVGPYNISGDPQNGTILYSDSGLTTPIASPFVRLFITGTIFDCTDGVLSNERTCPEPTTSSTTTAGPTVYDFIGSWADVSAGEACFGSLVTFYSTTPYGSVTNGSVLYIDSGLTTPAPYAYVALPGIGIVFSCSNGVLSNQSNC
jgi:hypothetical protein